VKTVRKSISPLAPSTQHPAPSIQHPAPSTQHPAPSTHHPGFSLNNSRLATSDDKLSKQMFAIIRENWDSKFGLSVKGELALTELYQNFIRDAKVRLSRERCGKEEARKIEEKFHTLFF
jgi:hypothetical protein